MGFYGSKLLGSNTTFKFDRIYPNRYDMDSKKDADGVYVGRYVLIDYGINDDTKNPTEGNFSRQYYAKPNTNPVEIYLDINYTPENRLKVAETRDDFYELIDYREANDKPDQFYYEKVNNDYIEIKPPFFEAKEIYKLAENVDAYILKGTIIYTLSNGVDGNKIFYRCSDEGKKGDYATFIKIANENLSNYTVNYNIDLEHYTNNNGGKGYDSTVWQKVYKDGEAIYVNIADLNAVVPTFDITADAPSEVPKTPHFDANSTNVYYNLHMYPSWGFRVKEAERETIEKYHGREVYSSLDEKSYPSDIKGKVNYYNKKDIDTDLAIYYNKLGFDADFRADETNIKANTEDNVIKIAPTGQSGTKYNTHDGTSQDKEPAPDVQELSMILPGLGNAVSELWDLAYGDWEANGEEYILDEKKDKRFESLTHYKKTGANYVEDATGDYVKNPTRNDNIEWGKTTGLRLVNERAADGYTFSPEQTKTIAGCINSVHDLMGMIVIPQENLYIEIEDNEENKILRDADSGKIYYNESDNKYYIKDYAYEYADIDKEKDLGKQIYVEVSVKDFDSADYYVEQNSDYYLQKTYIPDTTYYRINNIVKQTFNNKHWDPQTYYEKNQNGDYILESADAVYDSSKPIYDVNATDTLSYYVPGLYEDRFPAEFISSYWYSKKTNNKWYSLIEQDGILKYSELNKYNTDVSDPLKTYWELELATGDSSENVEIDGSPIGSYIKEKKQITFTQMDTNAYDYYYFDENNNYIKDINTYLNTAEDCTKYKIFGLPKNIGVELPFYQPNKYYYQKNGDKNFFKGDEQRHLDFNEVTYYSIESNREKSYFYEANKYYHLSDQGVYYLDTNEFDSDKEYYLKQTIHVMSDNDLGLFKYQVWNPNANEVPDGLVLKKRVIPEYPIYKWVELKGFARTLNTLHGLIVRINHLIEFNDIETRENLSAMGCINQMRDIINSFYELIPGQFVIVDKYGRIRSGKTETDEWLSVNIESDPEEPFIKFDHEFHAATPTTSTHDVNGNGDTIELYTPNVDDKGHVIGHDTKTVTLPFGFKSVNGLIADSTQDELIIEGDEWINVPQNLEDSSDNVDKITLTHSYSAEEPDILEDIDLNIIQSDNVVFPVSKFDETGHIVATNEQTLTLPYGYKTINGFEAESTHDEINISTETTDWIDIVESAEDKVININHKNVDFTEENKEESIQLIDTFTIPTYEFDEGGHAKKSITTEYILPKTPVSFGSIDLGEGKELSSTSSSESLKIVGDDFISIGINEENNSLQFNHDTLESVPEIVSPVFEDNVLSFQSIKNIDNAGHVLELENNSIDLPSYNIFSTLNIYSDEEQFENDTDTQNPSYSLKPIGKEDSLSIIAGENMSFEADSNNNKFIIGHEEKHSEEIEFIPTATDFNNTAIIPKIVLDTAGHIKSLESEEVIIPSRTITVKGSGFKRYSHIANEELVVMIDEKYAYYSTTLEDNTYYISFNDIIPVGSTVIIDVNNNGVATSDSCKVYNYMPSGPNTEIKDLSFTMTEIFEDSVLSGTNNFEIIGGPGIIVESELGEITEGDNPIETPHKIIISTSGENESSLDLNSELSTFDGEIYSEPFSEFENEMLKNSNGELYVFPADIKSTDNLNYTLDRMMAWIQALSLEVMRLKGVYENSDESTVWDSPINTIPYSNGRENNI